MPDKTSSSELSEPTGRLARLLEIMRSLRDPSNGCPWDIEQNFQSIAPYTIEEAYEVAEAISQGDMHELKVELGDLLFQVVFHSRMAEEINEFTFSDVVDAVIDKMERRHPHVFGEADIADASAQTNAWEAHKASERAAKGTEQSVLEDIPLALPALTRAVKLQKRAARVGFDWERPSDILDKLNEEMLELSAEMTQEYEQDPENPALVARVEHEFGDILFAYTNLARHMNIDPEAALRRCNGRFTSRFQFIEKALAQAGRSVEQTSLSELEELWQRAKQEE